MGRLLGAAVSRIPNFNDKLGRLQELFYRINRLAHSEQAYRENRTRAEGFSRATDMSSGYGYADPAEEIRVARMYKSDILSGRHANRESPALHAHVIDLLTHLIRQHAISQLINFGVSYAYVDSVLAKEFPDIRFIAIDRSLAVKDFNEADFKLPNMHFVAGDVMDWIAAQNKLDNALFFHMRTTVLLPECFVGALYRALGTKYVSIIAGFEPFGMSRQNNSIYEQSYSAKPSVLFRDSMYLHNYVGLLKEAGYDVTRLEYIKTGHVDADYRIQSFTAHRAPVIGGHWR
jgi:hypothetical protein